MMDYRQWNNYTAIGYVRYALDHYNKTTKGSGCRKLTGKEIEKIIECLYHAFDVKTLKEAYEYEG